ncbi:c-type cytochrome [Leadbetterella byssophila]|uniref:c-type cytochrome n=1 Tax=Leadbetterella byssophila TaxID=316068 RepID=UPI001651B12E|nr:cytochrome c [Leadbetterella byssophila]
MICYLSLSACTSKDQIRYEQFVITGGQLYQQHCANCHGESGQGLRELYPALTESKKLEDLNYLTCIIRKGGDKMPANKELYDLDIAQISTFLKYRWAKDKTITETEDVSKIQCAN